MCFSTETKPGHHVVGGGWWVVVVGGGGWWVVGGGWWVVGGWWCHVVSCWNALPWIRSKRPRVCLQNARVPHDTRTFCRHKRLRFECTHGNIALRCCRFGRCSLSSNRHVVVGRCRLVVVVVLSSCRLLAVVVMMQHCDVQCRCTKQHVTASCGCVNQDNMHVETLNLHVALVLRGFFFLNC